MLVPDLFNNDTHHFVDDDYDEQLVWEAAWATMTDGQRKEYLNRQALEDLALDAYMEVLNRTGNSTEARKAYHKVFNN